MVFDYYYGRSTEQFSFYQIPKLLITDEQFSGISTDAKLLYSMMLDRASLSARNGWLDGKGRVYIFYTLDQIMADMGCANQKATKMLKELETKAGLIERRKQGQGKPARIYVKDFATGLETQTHEIHESRDVIVTSPDSWKSWRNNTENNQTDYSETDRIHLVDDCQRRKIDYVLVKSVERFGRDTEEVLDTQSSNRAESQAGILPCRMHALRLLTKKYTERARIR